MNLVIVITNIIIVAVSTNEAVMVEHYLTANYLREDVLLLCLTLVSGVLAVWK